MSPIEIIKLIPVIIETIKAIEAVLPIPDKGKEKLDLVVNLVTDAYPDIQKFTGVLVTVISRLVKFLNTNGWNHKAEPVVEPVIVKVA